MSVRAPSHPVPQLQGCLFPCRFQWPDVPLLREPSHRKEQHTHVHVAATCALGSNQYEVLRSNVAIAPASNFVHSPRPPDHGGDKSKQGMQRSTLI
jgi:hypothetical protein